MYKKRFTVTISTVDRQPEDVRILLNDLLRPVGVLVLDVREELLPLSAITRFVPTTRNTTYPSNSEDLAAENSAQLEADDVGMEDALILQGSLPLGTEFRTNSQHATASTSAHCGESSTVAASDVRIPLAPLPPRDEFHKYLEALMNANATVEELEQLDREFASFFAHDEPKERVNVRAAVESDEDLSSGEDEDFDVSIVTNAVEEVMDGMVDAQETVAIEDRRSDVPKTRQPTKRNRNKLFGIDLADILAQAGDIDLDYPDSDDSLEEVNVERNAQEIVEDVLSDEDDDSADMEIDSGVNEFVDGVLRGLNEADEERRAGLKARRKKTKGAAGNETSSSGPASGHQDDEPTSDRSVPEESGPQSTTTHSHTELPEKVYDVSDAELLADIAELLGEDPAVEGNNDKCAEDSWGRSISNCPRSSGERTVKIPSKRRREDDESRGVIGAPKSPADSENLQQHRKSRCQSARQALESDSEYETSERDAAEADVESGAGDDDMDDEDYGVDEEEEDVDMDHDVDEDDVVESSDDSVAEIPDFSPKPIVDKRHLIMDKKLRPIVDKKHLVVDKKLRPVRVTGIQKDNELQRESKQALLREMQRQDRLEELLVYDGGILDQFEEDGTEFKVEVHPELWNKLEEHQKGGVKFMYRNVVESYEYSRTHPFGGCILAHSMGLGKTVQVICLLQAILSNEALNLDSFLVLCPASTVGNWENEVNQWMKGIPKGLTIKPYTLTGRKSVADRLRVMERWKRDGGVLIMSYAMFTTLCKADEFPRYLLDPGPDIVVCDEAHELKNYKSARTIAVSQISTGARIALTGTPMQNNLEEYFTMVNFVKPFLLGTRREFVNRFSTPIKDGSRPDAGAVERITMQKRSDVLREYLSACLQLKGAEILLERLPPKTEHVLWLRLTPLQKALYVAFTKQFQLEGGNTNDRLSCTRSAQLICFHPRCVQKDQDNERSKAHKNYMKKKPKEQQSEDEEGDHTSDVEGIDGSEPFTAYFGGLLPAGERLDVSLGAKTAILHEIIVQCVTNDEKLLIFSERRVVLSVVEELLLAIGQEKLRSSSGVAIEMRRGMNYLALDGSVPQARRPVLIDKFNKARSCYVFLLSTKAAGQGINLTGASRVVLLEPMWNPTVDLQASFRTYRYGQTKPVHVYRLVTAGTYEENIFQRQVDKQAMSNRVLKDKHARGSVQERGGFFRYTEHPFEAPFVPVQPPSDRIIRGILDKFPQAIVKTENFDSLLEPVRRTRDS